MRRRVRRQAMCLLALTAALLLATPAGALAADSRAAERSGGWTLAWEGLADLWSGVRGAVTGLVRSWSDYEPPPQRPEPLPLPPQPRPLPDPTPFGDGDDGGGVDPNG